LEHPLILALDIGSSSIRAAVYDGNARLIAPTLVKIEYQFVTNAAGAFEIDAAQLVKHVVTAIETVLKKAEKQKGEIRCIAGCALWHSLVGIDDRGRTTTPVFGWADTRGRAYSDRLKKHFIENEVRERTGAHFHSSFWPAKLLRLRHEFPEIWAKTSQWLSVSDYILMKLAGPAVTSVSMASGTGIFDQRRCCWDRKLLKYLGLSQAQLPPIQDLDAAAYKLKPSFAKRWPRLKHTRLLPAIGDGAADHVGAGGTGKHHASLMIGTSAAMRVVYAGEPPVRLPEGLFCYRLDRKRIVLGGALSDGGNLHKWLSEMLPAPSNASGEMRRRGADAHGLTFLPFLHGERGTGYHEDACGAILGLTASHDAVDILQAGLESVAYRLAAVFDRLRKGARIRTIAASGGALRESPIWAQIIADVLGRDLMVNRKGESAMRGAVLLALESLGKIENLDSLPPPECERLQFHPECHKAYKKGRKRHEQHYRILTDERHQ
jgi:gluconokinase